MCFTDLFCLSGLCLENQVKIVEIVNAVIPPSPALHCLRGWRKRGEWNPLLVAIFYHLVKPLILTGGATLLSGETSGGGTTHFIILRGNSLYIALCMQTRGIREQGTPLSQEAPLEC